jgi:hypothetical protein
MTDATSAMSRDGGVSPRAAGAARTATRAGRLEFVDLSIFIAAAPLARQNLYEGRTRTAAPWHRDG